MIHLGLHSEYTFRDCFCHLKDIVGHAIKNNMSSIGIADLNNTYGHIKFRKLCNDANIKPIFGVRLLATDTVEKDRSPKKTYNYITEVTFIAKNDDGLAEIYMLVQKAYSNFYYFPRITYDDVICTSDNVFVIAYYVPPNKLLLYSRIDYFAISDSGAIPLDTSFRLALEKGTIQEKPQVALINNKFINIGDKPVYEMLSYPKTYITPYRQWILNDKEALASGITQEAIDNTYIIADQCNANIAQAPMVKFSGNKKLLDECIKGAINLDIDLDDEIYSQRFKREIDLINERDFGDYFLIVSDMLKKAKEYCLVGPGRGSSGGSLVCYLMGITEIDPIKYTLLFERFIDINRKGLPDIDTDIPDVHRQTVIKYLSKQYGEDNVRALATISRYKPKSAIVDFAKALNIPEYETKDLKNSIIERSSGDARASLCIEDTLTGTDAGKLFIQAHPEMMILKEIENHSRHSGKHAAGVIVANKPLYIYGGIDSRESTIMTEGKDAESIGLLKIDVLGLRTLSILQETARLAGFDYKDYYSMELNDERTFDIFNNGRLYGIFQFEGKALSILTSQMGVHNFDDICAITSLGRPGALNSGGAAKYIKRRIGEEEPVYYGDIYERITKDTYGIVVYQEQTMMILKEFGDLSWGDVDTLRRAISKSLGDEFFATYKDRFIEGGIKNGYTREESEEVWHAVASMGSYGFNKSHAVAYSMISYWTAWAKAHYPLEFAAANLNNAKDDDNAVKVLRDFVVNDGIEYISVDPDESDVNWTIKDGMLLGGLTNLPGIGIKKAQKIIKDRKSGCKFTPSIQKMLMNPVTPFDILFPTKHYFGHLYDEPHKYGLMKSPSLIKDVQEPGEYVIIGIVQERDLRDRNDVQSVIKRKGVLVDEYQYYLNLNIEDDTDSIRCTISPFKFDELNGMHVSETSIPGETWYMIKGIVQEGWRSISIEAIYDIKDFMRKDNAYN